MLDTGRWEGQFLHDQSALCLDKWTRNTATTFDWLLKSSTKVIDALQIYVPVLEFLHFLLLLVEFVFILPLNKVKSSWNPNWIHNPMSKYPRTNEEFILSSELETPGFFCSCSCSSPSLNPLTVGNLKMNKLQAFHPWIPDSLVNVWKALWSSRLLSAIIIRDHSYACWLKKIIITFHSFFPFIEDSGNWLPSEVARKSWVWCRHGNRMEKSKWITLRMERVKGR